MATVTEPPCIYLHTHVTQLSMYMYVECKCIYIYVYRKWKSLLFCNVANFYLMCERQSNFWIKISQIQTYFSTGAKYHVQWEFILINVSTAERIFFSLSVRCVCQHIVEIFQKISYFVNSPYTSCAHRKIPS